MSPIAFMEAVAEEEFEFPHSNRSVKAKKYLAHDETSQSIASEGNITEYEFVAFSLIEEEKECQEERIVTETGIPQIQEEEE